ncbi:MAG TPA: phage protein Gp36 family protein [Vampirovibrionales bacterium]
MTAYALPEDFVATYGFQESVEISNLENPTAENPNLVEIDLAIALASSEIDSILGARYVVPISPPTPLILAAHALCLARYRLDRYRRRADVVDDYKLAVSQLEKMATGKVALARPDATLVEPAAPSQESAFGDVSYYAPDPIWTRENLTGYQRIVRRY